MKLEINYKKKTGKNPKHLETKKHATKKKNQKRNQKRNNKIP